MITNFVEMVNVKIEEEDSLIVCVKYGEFSDMNCMVPDSIIIDDNIIIKGEWRDMVIPSNCKISYDEFEEEYIIEYSDMTHRYPVSVLRPAM